MTIDWWTLGFQAVNVAILIWLLHRFFWKPVAAMIATRRATVQKLTDDAIATRDAATVALADVDRTRAGFATEREAIIADAQKAAEAVRAALLAKAQAEAEAIETAARTAAAGDEKAQRRVWASQSTRLAISIAGRLAARLEGTSVQGCFLEWLLDEIRKLPEPARKAARTSALELTSAAPLDAAEQERCTKSIADALGGAPAISFGTDADLIAGFELRGAQLIVSSSWRADLATIEADLAREQPQ